MMDDEKYISDDEDNKQEYLPGPALQPGLYQHKTTGVFYHAKNFLQYEHTFETHVVYSVKHLDRKDEQMILDYVKLYSDFLAETTFLGDFCSFSCHTTSNFVRDCNCNYRDPCTCYDWRKLIPTQS